MKYRCSVIILTTILFALICTYFIPSLKMENSENRTLATFDMVINPDKNSVVYHDSPVERLDAALSDQFAFRGFFVNEYLKLFNVLESIMHKTSTILFSDNDTSIFLHSIGKYWMINDTGILVGKPDYRPLDQYGNLTKKSEQLQYIHKKYPDLKLYNYYTSRIIDMPWFSSQSGIEAVSHYQQIVQTTSQYIKHKQLIYKNLDDYLDVHFMTDNHWNHKGSHRGYEDIYKMINQDFDLNDMLVPVAEHNVSKTYDFKYIGKYGKSLGELYTQGYDDFSFYEYDIPQRKLYVIDKKTLDEIEVAKMGLYDEYKNGMIDKNIKVDHYVVLYGTAKDSNNKQYKDSEYPFVIKNDIKNGKNLLVTGDSYFRSIRDEISSHFNTTVFIDYRLLSKIPIDYIIEKYDIDILLICSHTNTWRSKEYLYTFMEDE